MFLDHDVIKLEISNTKILEKSLSIWKLKNTCLNNAWVE